MSNVLFSFYIFKIKFSGHESKKFKSYFPGGILIKEGGVKSGFNHVEVNNYDDIRRLLHVKGFLILAAQ